MTVEHPVFHLCTTLDDFSKALMVRAIVFLEEQQVAYADEVDDLEYSALHILGEMEGEPMAAARMRFLGEYAKLERIAVRKGWRGRGLGHELVEYMLKIAREKGFHKFKMHAQAHLVEFYRMHGFEPKGEMFQEAKIDHYLMVREDR
ncbi:MAG TPA: GNAT family N-acetyltransferase [bacterium]|nr:GNAT family N-acetyltransferase [bacterium]HQG45647.1 GNAT family N-acetyltransferase [bacterium]HQI50151.1 GNAT family N-acetyltransferase [bacterium]HQJ66004.1 GNAT family N-acetyltransferase [bacterium]